MRISRNPNATNAVFGVVSALRKLGLLEEEHKRLISQAENRDVFKNRKMLGTVDLQGLRQLPAGTLGRIYADHMFDNKLDPNFYEVVEIDDDSSYVVMRMRQTHDLWHAITGFDTTVEGELALQAFMMAQMHTPLAPFLIGGQLIVYGLRNPMGAREIMEKTAQGWLLGKKSKSIFAIDWESHWATPISDLRSAYNI